MALSSAWALIASHSLSYATLEVWAYCIQNTSTLKSTVYTELGIRGGSQWYSTDGVKAGITGASDISWGYTRFNAGTYYKLTGGSYTVSHNTTTGKANTTIYYWLDQTFGGDIASSGSPASVTVELPTIFIKPPAGNASGIAISASPTYNSVTLSFSGGTPGSGASISYYRVKGLGYSDYTQVSNPVTITGLNPNTSYTFTVDFVDNYGTTASGSTSKSFTTPKPAAPGKGSVSSSSVTYNGAKLSWSGFSFGAGATWGKYQYSWNNSNWTDCGTSTSLTFTDKSPNTGYTFYVRLVDNYGQASAAASTTFTTSKPAAGNASTITYSASTSSTSITISMAGGTPGAGGAVSYYRIKCNGASSYSKVSNPAVFTGLTADTSYSFSIDFVDNYGTVASGSVSGTASTVLPSTPVKGVVSARSITDTSAVISWMGFSFATGATWGKYQYKIGSGSWVDYSTNQNLSLTGLTPSTQYTVYIRLVDNFGTVSDAASVTFTTQEKKKWASGSVFIKVDGVWKRGTVYYKSNNAWVKYNGAFIKKEN